MVLIQPLNLSSIGTIEPGSNLKISVFDFFSKHFTKPKNILFCQPCMRFANCIDRFFLRGLNCWLQSLYKAKQMITGKFLTLQSGLNHLALLMTYNHNQCNPKIFDSIFQSDKISIIDQAPWHLDHNQFS